MTEKLLTEQIKRLDDVRANYEEITENIALAAEKSGRTAQDISFLAATKTVEPEIINYAISLGLKKIGENRVQELLSKYDEYDLAHADLQFIGHLQKNKVRQIIGKVSMIQSVDSIKLADEIAKQSVKNNITTDILIEVNIGREESKSGVMKEELDELIQKISVLEGIRIRGLMSIPPICDSKKEISKFFDDMYKLFIDISAKKSDNVNMDFLSMGMSDDYTEAILSGANMIRVGSRLFGARIYR
ncbi:MAG: YggS family pyridoxal phosphate-dependent enzyme [Clostridia bacterium]|nr:YggS family pyridoxal phosphate-dependent enzyme [Clostridia bacterium]